MRRLIIVEPVARAALWSRRFAVFGLLLGAIAVMASRSGAVDPPGAIAVLGAALVFAATALLAALVAAVVIWRTGRPGIGPALGGTALACLLLAYPVYLAQKAARLPDLSDISTDPSSLVRFSTATKAVGLRRGALHGEPSAQQRQQQAAAYPDLRPLMLDVPAADVYRAALKLMAKRRWSVTEAQAPTGKPAIGHIEAVARTAVMAFRDDVALRIKAIGAGQTQVDMRSASRFNRRDIGANAVRIQGFLSDLEDAADAE